MYNIQATRPVDAGKSTKGSRPTSIHTNLDAGGLANSILNV